MNIKSIRENWFVAFFAVLMLGGSLLYAQSNASLISFSPTRGDVATKVANCNSAVNTTCTATATPSGSNYVYITGIDLAICGDATGTAQTNVTWTSTGLTGTPIMWAYSASTGTTAGLCQYKEINYATPVKSTTPGVAVTVVSPAIALHTGYNANVFWYEGQ